MVAALHGKCGNRIMSMSSHLWQLQILMTNQVLSEMFCQWNATKASKDMQFEGTVKFLHVDFFQMLKMVLKLQLTHR